MKNQPLWLDVSKWQNDINYTALSQAEETVHGIFSRAGWGENGGYLDPQFQRNWSKSKQFGYYRSSYWAYWDYYPMLHQLDLWYQANPTMDTIPRMWDLEKEGAPPEFLSEQTWLASQKVLSRDGARFIIYSRVDILERTLCKYWTPEQLNKHYYLLAQYDVGDGVEYNGIVIPDFIDPKNVLWKQTSDKIHMFTGSGPMDRDRWIWTGVDDMHKQIKETWGPAEPEPPETDCCEELADELDYYIVKQLAHKEMIDTNAAEIEKATEDYHDIDDTIVKFNEEYLVKFKLLQEKITELDKAVSGNFNFVDADIEKLQKEVKDLENYIGASFLVESEIEERITKTTKPLQDQIENLTVQCDHTHPAWMVKWGLVK